MNATDLQVTKVYKQNRWEALHRPTNLVVYNDYRDIAIFELGKLVGKQLLLQFDKEFGE